MERVDALINELIRQRNVAQNELVNARGDIAVLQEMVAAFEAEKAQREEAKPAEAAKPANDPEPQAAE